MPQSKPETRELKSYADFTSSEIQTAIDVIDSATNWYEEQKELNPECEEAEEDVEKFYRCIDALDVLECDKHAGFFDLSSSKPE